MPPKPAAPGEGAPPGESPPPLTADAAIVGPLEVVVGDADVLLLDAPGEETVELDEVTLPDWVAGADWVAEAGWAMVKTVGMDTVTSWRFPLRDWVRMNEVVTFWRAHGKMRSLAN
jgi:hypothetical protein